MVSWSYVSFKFCEEVRYKSRAFVKKFGMFSWHFLPTNKIINTQKECFIFPFTCLSACQFSYLVAFFATNYITILSFILFTRRMK